MKKSISAIILLSVITGPASAADTLSRDNPSPSPSPQYYQAQRLPNYAAEDPAFVAIDITLLRPLSFVATVIGSAFFVASSPLTALASIPEPHDAFESAYKVMVLTPARYTFERPVGDRTLMEGYNTQFGKMPTSRQSSSY